MVAILAALGRPLLAGAEGVAWRSNLDAAKIEAAQSNRLLLLHFYTRTCAPCRVLDQNVLSQPHVGGAVERDFVPVKIDADTAPALANMFHIDHVPCEVVLTPQGNVLTKLSTPDNADAYVAQLQNLARHFRQTTPGGQTGPAPPVNSAYAALPVRTATPAMPATPPASVAGAMAPPVAPQHQVNRYASGPAVGAPATNGGSAPGTATVAANSMPAGPAMPGNAMPTSYRNTMFAAPPVPVGGPAIPATAPQAGAPNAVATAAAPAAQTTAAAPPLAAYANVGVGAAAGAAAANPAITPAPTAAQGASTGPNAATLATASPAAAGPAAPASVQPTQQQLPPNCPPVAFDGCCPVTLKTLNAWKPGNATIGLIHRGRTYLFAGEEQRTQFWANPDAYSPVFAGYDPVLLLDKKQTVPGSRKFGFRYGDAFYLFSCAETRDQFRASPHTYAAGVRQAMARVDGSSGDLIRR
ncbi:MAG TPA: thioredoxin family protein [Lacipirellulaceae bacterium]|nr:thioredoxin family protein [Lacipirellulaceae bacterium]